MGILDKVPLPVPWIVTWWLKEARKAQGIPEGAEMTEDEWLKSTNLRTMFDCLPGTAGERKLRLFACACCRRVWPLLTDSSRAVVVVAERFSDGLETSDELVIACRGADAAFTRCSAEEGRAPARFAARAAASTASAYRASTAYDVAEDVAEAISYQVANETTWANSEAARAGRLAAKAAEKRQLADLLREIIATPFRTLPDPEEPWPSTVVALAEAIYQGEDCAFALHDALVEAGEEVWAEHFRLPEHPRGCKVIDWILGKK